jgi:hypothetical protein
MSPHSNQVVRMEALAANAGPVELAAFSKPTGHGEVAGSQQQPAGEKDLAARREEVNRWGREGRLRSSQAGLGVQGACHVGRTAAVSSGLRALADAMPCCLCPCCPNRLVGAFGSTRRRRQLQQRADGAVVVTQNASAGELDVLMAEVQERAAAAGDTREEVSLFKHLPLCL